MAAKKNKLNAIPKDEKFLTAPGTNQIALYQNYLSLHVEKQEFMESTSDVPA